MTYINMKHNGIVETIDGFDTFKAASKMLVEYQLCVGNCYLSNRATKAWRES